MTLTTVPSELRLDHQSSDRRSFSAEQETAIHARAPVVALSAGAGSGKTTVLVERFVDLVHRDGVSPLEILAITFTEKAAAEMKARIVKRFEERNDVRSRRQAEAAYIATIHGFCARLLRENPLAAGLDPAFHVMDELTRSIFLDEQLDLLYSDDWYAENEGWFTKRYDAQRPCLFELIEEAAFLPSEFGSLAATEQGYTLEQHVAAAMGRVRAFADEQWKEGSERLLSVRHLIDGAVVTGSKLKVQHANMCDFIAGLARGGPRDASAAKRFGESTGFTGTMKSEGVEDVRAALKTVKPLFANCAQIDLAQVESQERERFAPLKVGIYARAAALRNEYEEFKRRHGYLDFDDMQRRALVLLDDADVREQYACRFKHILLDEAQDANDVQIAIVRRLQDGRQSLFAVGDVKQSIYGFRGANVEIFQDLCHPELSEGPIVPASWLTGHDNGTVGPSVATLPRDDNDNDDRRMLSLVDNYRSRGGVTDVVNEVSGRLWSDGSIDFEALQTRFEYEPHGTDPRVELWIVEQRKPELAPEVREREAVALAAWIRDAVDGTNPFTIYSREDGSYRRVRYGDIAILANSRTPFPAFERALADFGIPFAKDGARDFFDGREVKDLLAALRTIANPLDDPSLLAALRSPLFGWGDADLVRLRIAAGPGALWYSMRDVRPEELTAATDAYDTLSRLRRYSTFVPPVRMIEMICDVTAFRAALMCLPRGRAQVANIDRFIEFARATAALDGPSLAAFLHRAALAEEYLGRDTGAPVSTSGEDVVVLSTIHGAKGLEWPVVMLAGLDNDFARSDVGSRYVAADGALILQVRDAEGETIRSEANRSLADRAKARDEAEGRRLLYVAMTRARERLVLSGRSTYGGKSKKPGLSAPIEWLITELGISAPGAATSIVRLGHASLRVEFVSPESVAPLRASAGAMHDQHLAAARRAVRDGRAVEWSAPAAGDEDGVAHASAVVRRVLAEEAPAWATQRALVATTVTQLVYYFRCPLVYYFNLVLRIDEHPRGRGKAGAIAKRKLGALERGTRVHELLERADLHAEPRAEAARLAGLSSDVPAEERGRMESMLATVLGDPLIDRARKATRLEREYPFYLDIGGTMVQGVIDLVFQDAEGKGVVVDYKSNDLAAPGRMQTLSELYRPQIELYALAAKRAGLVEPNEATLYFLNKPGAATTQLDARRLDVVQEDAGDALGRITRSAWDTEPGEKCRNCGYRKRGYCEVGKRFKE